MAQIGFGVEKLRIVGENGKRHPFLIPPLSLNDTNDVFTFDGPTVEEKFSRKWFIVFVLCERKPELCGLEISTDDPYWRES